VKQYILVLGANGFIGREIVAALAATDWAIPILGVRTPAVQDEHRFEQRTVEASDVGSVATAMREVQGVVNCVAGDAQIIVTGAKALFQVAADLKPQPRIVHLSTMSVYGSVAGKVDETAPLRGDLGPYSAAKVAAEAVASAYPRAVIFRPGCVFGPGSEQWTIRIARLLMARRLGDLGAAGDGYCNLVHVRDVAVAILGALKDPGTDGSTFNLSIPDAPTWNEFLVKYGMALGAIPVRRISQRRLRIESKLLAPPLKIVEILGRIAKLDARRLPPFIPPSLVRSMQQEIRLDSKRAETALGLKWTGLEAMLDEGARWFLGSRYSDSKRS
jgi:2-alkyl-3-oxoalkanoate reductase